MTDFRKAVQNYKEALLQGSQTEQLEREYLDRCRDAMCFLTTPSLKGNKYPPPTSFGPLIGYIQETQSTLASIAAKKAENRSAVSLQPLPA
ncbi:MAG: hypothetical protein HY918_04080 [Candidatus Doudnabacteria bacterium]|nr:hypothetical protein [Candidatus Doudnabacteria bacterium]